ncbi:MAG TPA: ABC transporter permease [Bryobacteraceae bacterium]|jgi:putative ABC transport system permease protein|nr:ABC transporter permease [Bryobacteraceae bacterium]
MVVVWRFFEFCRNIFRRKRVERELDEEIHSYLELMAAEKESCGMAREEAVQMARRDLDGLDHVKESVRDVRTGVSLDILMQDIRYALRALARNRAFSTVAILTLGLGIGANTTIFTVVNGVLLKPLPYPEPDRLLMLFERQLSNGTLGTVAPANFFDWREQGHSFDKMAAIDPYPDFILNGAGEAKRLAGAAVSSDFFPLLGVRMVLGRGFLAEEDRPEQNQVVVLSYSTWQRNFGGRPDVVGQRLALNNTGYTVVGVLPRDFSLVSRASDFQSRNQFDVWTPLALPAPPEAWQRGTHPLCVFARLKPGIPIEQAQADLNRIAGNLQRLYPADDKEAGIAAVPMSLHVVANVRAALFTLLAAVGMVLLIACANVANLLLTRAVTRRKEMALRVTLGASPRRLAQQLLTESMVLAVIGGVLGFAIAFLSVPALVRYLPADLPRTSEILVDGRVLAFTSLLSLINGIVFGLVPLFQSRRVSARVSANDSLKQSGRGVAAGQSRLRSALIVGQVAVALVLLTGAGLMTRSFWNLLRVAPGFRTEHILTARLSLPPQYTDGYISGTGIHRRISAFQQQLLERVSSIPGVQSAAFTAYLPLSGADNSWSFYIEGRPAKPAGVFDMTNYRPVTAGYFETIGIPVERGRSFNSTDDEDHPLVVIVNQSMARSFWGQQNPIGQRLRFGDSKLRTIVGVVGDVHHEALGSKPTPEMYVPYSQVPNVEARPTVVLRTSVEPARVTSALRGAVSEVDSNVPMDHIETMQQIVSGSVGQSRFRTAVLAMFAVLALFVASIGLYGVMSYLVSQRIREFGIRMAVGASRGAVLRMVLVHAAKLVGIGICVGWVGAALLARLITSLLFEVAPFDPATLAIVSVSLAVVALVASLIPAQRAAKADPMSSLRYE